MLILTVRILNDKILIYCHIFNKKLFNIDLVLLNFDKSVVNLLSMHFYFLSDHVCYKFIGILKSQQQQEQQQ